MKIDETTTLREIIDGINAEIDSRWGNNEERIGFCWTAGLDGSDRWYACLKGYRWLAVYPVEGNSEGHYLHVDAATGYTGKGAGRTKHLLQMKTFNGFERAQELARLVQLLLTKGTGNWAS